MELIDEVVAVLEGCGEIGDDCKGEDGFEDVVWSRLWSWTQTRCDSGGPWEEKRPGQILLTSHSARKERDATVWKSFQKAPDKLADSPLLDGCFSRVDIVLHSPKPEVTIGIEVERIKRAAPGKRPKTDPLIHGLGQAALSLALRRWAVLVVYWPLVSGSGQTRDKRRQLQAELEGRFCDRRLRVVIVP